MEEHVLPYELELKLKDLGCDKLINYTTYDPYPTENKAILYEQAFDWFRKEHKLHVMFETVLMSYGLVDCRNNDMKIVRFISAEDRFLNKSELKTEALKELIELVETKKDSV